MSKLVKPKTGIMMLNLGGPATLSDVGPFLLRLFSDREIIQLPLQKYSAPWIAKRRTPKVTKLYSEIGGGSPILKWTEKQGAKMVAILDEKSPETAPHKFYVGFRYANPLTEDALLKMKEDGVERAVAFSQYPQYSCTTTGSSLNELWRQLEKLDLTSQFKWSIIDRWFEHDGFTQAIAKKVRKELDKVPERHRDKAVIMFSAHSLPMRVINRGDAYPHEIAVSMHKVMKHLNVKNPFLLSYQSQVGPLPWQGPSTPEMIKRIAKIKSNDPHHENHIVIVPIAFTSDHIETLSEIDIEFAHVAKESGIHGFYRSESLNDSDDITSAMADIVMDHFKVGQLHSHHYPYRCPGCINPDLCRSIRNPASNS